MQASLHSFFSTRSSEPVPYTPSLDSDTASIASASSIDSRPTRQHIRTASPHGVLTFLLRRRTQAGAPKHYKPAAWQLLKEQHRHLQAAARLLPVLSVQPLSGTHMAVIHVDEGVEVRTWPPPAGVASARLWPKACPQLPAHAAVLRPARCSCPGCLWTLSEELSGIAWRQRCALDDSHAKLFAIAKRPASPGLGSVTTCSAAMCRGKLQVCAGWESGHTMGWAISCHGPTPASVAVSWTFANGSQHRNNLAKWTTGDNRPFSFQSWWRKPVLTWSAATRSNTPAVTDKPAASRRSASAASTFGLQHGLACKRVRPAAAGLARPVPPSGTAIAKLAKSSSALKAKLSGLARRANQPSTVSQPLAAGEGVPLPPRASLPPRSLAPASASRQEIPHVLLQAQAQGSILASPAMRPDYNLDYRRQQRQLVQCCFVFPYVLLWYRNSGFVALDLTTRTQSMAFAESLKLVESAYVAECFSSPSAICVQPDGRAACAASQLLAREPHTWNGRVLVSDSMRLALVAQHGVLCISSTGLAVALRWRPAPCTPARPRAGSAAQSKTRAGRGFVVAGLAVPAKSGPGMDHPVYAPTLPQPTPDAPTPLPAAPMGMGYRPISPRTTPARGMQVLTTSGPRLAASDPRIAPAYNPTPSESTPGLRLSGWLQLDCHPWVGRVWLNGNLSLYSMCASRPALCRDWCLRLTRARTRSLPCGVFPLHRFPPVRCRACSPAGRRHVLA